MCGFLEGRLLLTEAAEVGGNNRSVMLFKRPGRHARYIDACNEPTTLLARKRRVNLRICIVVGIDPCNS